MSGQSLLHKVRRIRPTDLPLMVEARCVLGGVRVGLRWMRYALLLRLLRNSARMAGRLQAHPKTDPEARILWTIDTIGRKSRAAPSCLEEALSVQWMLRRRRIESDIRIGVAKKEDGSLHGHAWVERDGRVISVDAISPANFTVLTGKTDEQIYELHRRHLSF